MRLFLGPSDLLHAATSVRVGVSEAVDDVVDLFELIGRGADLMGRAEDLMTRAEGLLERTELVVAEVEAVTEGAAQTVDAAAAATAGASGLALEGQALMAPVRRFADTALPLATTVVESISAQEAQAVIRAIDRTPQLIDSLEKDVIPMLGRLEEVGPDVHAILEAVSELANAINGLPGMGLLQRRGERKEDEDSSD